MSKQRIVGLGKRGQINIQVVNILWMRILEEADRVIRRRTLKFVKVLWMNQTEREATRELITKI
jgi:hypothetical protein